MCFFLLTVNSDVPYFPITFVKVSNLPIHQKKKRLRQAEDAIQKSDRLRVSLALTKRKLRSKGRKARVSYKKDDESG